VLSLVIPVYNNEASLPRLFREVEAMAERLEAELEVVFVVDGGTDSSLQQLQNHLPRWPVSSQLIELSRNFGSFAAIAAGLRQARGAFLVVIAADLQEPPELVLDFHRILRAETADIVFGQRTKRTDPWLSQVMSRAFWGLYRRCVVKDMPPGGVDVFGCTREVADQLGELREANTNLVALLLWLGFRRQFVPYERRPRLEGRSGWTFRRRVRYAFDSVFSFTDLPISALLLLGALGTLSAIAGGITVLTMWALGRIPVLGYTPLMLVITFFGGLTALGLGIIGQYLWLSLQNARRRPNFVVRTSQTYDRRSHRGERQDGSGTAAAAPAADASRNSS
jgi:glycosyltransferase involved in cell wall biosynthesis